MLPMIFLVDSILTDAGIDVWQKYHRTLPDGGPVYTETDFSRFFVEPWNAFSSLLFLIPAIIWIIRLRGRYNTYRFLVCCLPWLMLGGLGSTLFHALRQYPFFLLMDIIPMAILTLSVCIYLWIKLLPHWWQVFFILFPFLLLRWIFFSALPPHTAINLSYAITGLFMLLPIAILLVKTARTGFKPVSLAFLFLAVSLFLRETDAWGKTILPMGTHFLWHAFSSAGAWFLAEYLYLLRTREIEQSRGKAGRFQQYSLVL